MELADTIVDPSHLTPLPQLRELTLDRCTLMTPGLLLLAALRLEQFTLRNCLPMERQRVETLAEFVSVRELEFHCADAVIATVGIQALAKLTELRDAIVDAPHRPEVFAALGELQQLESLDVGCMHLRRRQIDPLRNSLKGVLILTQWR